VPDLAVREAQADEPRRDVLLVTPQILRLLLRRAVIGESVGLDDQPQLRPVEVDLVTVDDLPRQRARKPGPQGDRNERTLQAGPREAEGADIEDLPQRLLARPRRHLVEARAQPLRIGEALDVGLVDDRLDLVARADRREVDDRAFRRGDRDAVPDRRLERSAPVNHEAAPLVAAPHGGHGHVDRPKQLPPEHLVV
jgi:hypothetical protein